MKRFHKIVLLDDTGMNEIGRSRLPECGEEICSFSGVPDAEEAVRRIGDADCVLLSQNTALPRGVIERCPNLRYVGLSCSLFRASPASCKVDLAACDERGIEVTGIFHYGDNGVVEYVVAAVTMLLHGHQGLLWGDYMHEITGRKFGVIGLGVVGRLVCRAMQFFGAEIYYTGRSAQADAEALGYHFLPKEELLRTADIVSIHVPRGSCVMGEREFEVFGDHKILINTSLGVTFDVPAMERWLREHEDAFFVADRDGAGEYWSEFSALPRTMIAKNSAGASVELTNRRSEKMLENMRQYLQRD